MSTFITTLPMLVLFSDKPPAVKEFENRIKAYVELRQRIDSGFPETKESSNAALILKQKERFGKALREARPTAKQGDIFIPAVRPILLKVIKSALAGPGGARARSMILGEGNPKAEGSEAQPVLKVNALYPSAAPVSSVPPSILLALPQLPEELEYRFVGRYYSFKPKEGVRFFALDSNYMDQDQVKWLEKELSMSGSEWKILFFHHPIYSSGEKHGSNIELRSVLEPLIVKYGVDVVFAGHEHFYERIRPQKGAHHFIVGSSAKLRKGNIAHIAQTSLTAKGYDRDNVYLLAQIQGDQMTFNVVNRKHQIIDSGVILRAEKNKKGD